MTSELDHKTWTRHMDLDPKFLILKNKSHGKFSLLSNDNHSNNQKVIATYDTMQTEKEREKS